ncbi:zinc finger CCHC-type containing 7 [Musca autumnalis]|uniref:zinc finger CCHC-type containing 7 n=1 Tax=Musca autumnalis TaxID=221902 RepID=UPI003CF92400
MDEVDIDNEDLNELEARLYAQIHHEASSSSIDVLQSIHSPQIEPDEAESTDKSKVPRRYWVNENSAFKPRQQNHHPQVRMKQQHTYDVNQQRVSQPQQPNQKPAFNIPVKSGGNGQVGKELCDSEMGSCDNKDAAESVLVETNISCKSPAAKDNSSSVQPANKFKQGQSKHVTLQKNNPNLRLNPAANWNKKNKAIISNKDNAKEMKNANISNTKQGPFFKQQQKIQKMKKVEDKKQKSKKVKEKLKGKKPITTDIIELISSEESDGSDVVVIPIPPPPTFTVDDSDDDNSLKKDLATNTTVLQTEENALDSTDVQMSTSSSFIKPPQQTSMHNTSNSDSADKRLENSSRCTSPCSIQSSDDFIGHVDRSRLLESASGVADDEDLLILTSDVNSLLEAPQKNSSTNKGNKNTETQDSFAKPKHSNKETYRVEQTQFRALDVYESESDITDSVYSKGTAKTTVIRQLDTSSDDAEDISIIHSSRTKRFRKRRASSSNKGSDANYENTQSSSENSNEENDDDEFGPGTEPTGIPFISRGPAVERKIRKNSRTLSSCSPAPQKSFKPTASKGHMSDGDFIAKLNNLVQGQDEDNEAEESDDAETAPSAREIAAKILGEIADSDTKETTSAIPNSVCQDLNDVFNTIDKMEEKEQEQYTQKQSGTDGNTNRANKIVKDVASIVYKNLPTDDKVQIITYVADDTSLDRRKNTSPKRSRNGSPIYNVVYIRGNNILSGIGWNSEMKKFYEDSWNGEHFILSHVWNKMNPDKNLWKIYAEDRFTKSTKRYSNLKCTNCCDFGHSRSQCKRPKKPLICYMCGESGHQEPRCPNTICLRCGNKTHVFIKGCNACSFQNRLICPICKIRGHSIDFCPDKWRRYYSTTEPNAFPRNNIVYNTKKYCSLCGQRGHLSDVCRNAMNFMEYPPIATAVKSHQKSYNDLAFKSTHGGTPFNLMYEPTQEYTFCLAERTNPEKYYGRFLNAVGLSYLIPRKRRSDASTETPAKKLKKSSRKSENLKSENKAPNQVQEISESGSVENDNPQEAFTKPDDIGEAESTVQNEDNIQLNIITPTETSRGSFSNFKSPNNVTSSNIQPQNLDSDSNYSFSEHFDVPSTSSSGEKEQAVSKLAEVLQDENANAPLSSTKIWTSSIFKERPKPREMAELPDFIPLVDSTKDNENEQSNVDNQIVVHADNRRPSGISNRFVAAESDDDSNDGVGRPKEMIQSDGLPCEAKIYLNQFHTKYLLSLDGRNFLAKSSKECDLKARLDFTTVGHVLVIFGLPNNQDKFQRELLMKYREIADQMSQKSIQSMPNIPKRIDVLIRFLRDDINQLNTNLGNANHLYKRLQYVERQQSKAGFKQADKIRRSLNMILVGQAGLQDGNIHLDKLLLSLKTLINDYKSEDATPPQLRSEISSHWKFIFSSYRHDNYEELLRTYNNMVLKNRMLKLSIDPLLLGNKLLDTSLTLEQKEKMEQAKPIINDVFESDEPCTAHNQQKTPKPNKRKQIAGASNSATPPSTPIKIPTTQSQRSDEIQGITPTKAKSTAINSTSSLHQTKKQQTKIMPPPPFTNPEKRSNATVNAAIMQQVSEKWKNTCDTLLKEISKPPARTGNGNNVRDSKLPSTFWSRESMRYLDECIPIVSSRPELEEKLKRVQNKSKNGQLSYNDYLAVIKLHTALTGK